MKYPKEFVDLINTEISDELIGVGNPASNILLIGKEPAIHEDNKQQREIEIEKNYENIFKIDETNGFHIDIKKLEKNENSQDKKNKIKSDKYNKEEIIEENKNKNKEEKLGFNIKEIRFKIITDHLKYEDYGEVKEQVETAIQNKIKNISKHNTFIL